jgi:hypothetical protein
VERTASDEADGVRQEGSAPGGERQAPHGGVEGGEEAVLHQDPGSGEPVEQARLPGVGIAHQGGGGQPGAPAPLALRGPGGAQPLDLALQHRDTTLHPATVALQLGLTRSPGADAASLLAQFPASAPQPGEAVTEQGQLHLGHTLAAGGVLGEDVQDHRHPVHHVAPEDLRQVALLDRGEFPVDHYHVHVEPMAQGRQFGRFPLADEGGRVGVRTLLDAPIDGVGAGGVGQPGQLLQRDLGVGGGVAVGGQRDQQGALAANRQIGDGGGEAASVARGAVVGHEGNVATPPTVDRRRPGQSPRRPVGAHVAAPWLRCSAKEDDGGPHRDGPGVAGPEM